jgi:hypothetical protein
LNHAARNSDCLNRFEFAQKGKQKQCSDKRIPGPEPKTLLADSRAKEKRCRNYFASA